MMLVLVPQRADRELPGVYLYFPRQVTVKTREILTTNTECSTPSGTRKRVVRELYDRSYNAYVF